MHKTSIFDLPKFIVKTLKPTAIILTIISSALFFYSRSDDDHDSMAKGIFN